MESIDSGQIAKSLALRTSESEAPLPARLMLQTVISELIKPLHRFKL